MKNHFVLPTFLLLLLSSCDPIYDIAFDISNQSSAEIEVILKNQFNENDTIIIPSQTNGMIYNDMEKGAFANDRYINLDSIPIEFISISQANKNYKNNPKDKSFWDWSNPKKRDGNGTSTLTICSSDLE